MCLVPLAFQCHEEYPLVLASNRDEYFVPGRRHCQLGGQSTRIFSRVVIFRLVEAGRESIGPVNLLR